MSKHVFITGAGASVSSGCPTMLKFLELAEKIYHNTDPSVYPLWNDDLRHSFEKVRDAIRELQRVHSKSQFDLINIESIFNSFEMARLIGGFGRYDKAMIIELIDCLIKMMAATIESSMIIKNDGGGWQYPPGYCGLMEKISALHGQFKNKSFQDYSFITFNYDIGLELGLLSRSITPNYYLENSPGSEADGVAVLKLHGSINWYLNNGDVHIPKVGDSIKKFHRFPGAPNSGLGYIRFRPESAVGLGDKVNPLIVPPAWNKSDYHTPIAKVWEKSAEVLKEADYIHVIGYSMPETDSYFKMLYALGTFDGPPLKGFHVYNPDSSGVVKNRFVELMGPGALSRFTYDQIGFPDCIQLIINRIKTSP